MNGIGDHGAWIDAAVFGNAFAEIASGAADEGDADRVHNDGGRHSNGKTDESMGKGLASFGDFAGIARREDILISAVDDVADNEISGKDGDVGGDISGDGPEVAFDAVFE